ncbi:hypothetical protein KU306_07620 [Haloferax larsenii]|uniref:Uncharacterized protein n=1 Tax=Haloferax larsenii TaxID=302484 RepID=A0ABY5RKK6_HALLR|nr:hypothetical protein [Haloferax larsenii]UVE51725.1 hypothetical protein KU306_07620 [Haloferax larsenii]
MSENITTNILLLIITISLYEIGKGVGTTDHNALLLCVAGAFLVTIISIFTGLREKYL